MWYSEVEGASYFWCLLDHSINGLLNFGIVREAELVYVAGSNLPFALISLFLGVVLNYPLSYQNESLNKA